MRTAIAELAPSVLPDYERYYALGIAPRQDGGQARPQVLELEKELDVLMRRSIQNR